MSENFENTKSKFQDRRRERDNEVSSRTGIHRPERSITVNGRNNGAKMNGTNARSTE